MALKLPCLDISSEINAEAFPGYRTYLFSRSRRLLVSENEVVVFHGPTMARKLIYDEEVLFATYTRFLGISSLESEEALAVCFRTSARLYYLLGTVHDVSFPCLMKNAFGLDLGILLERELDNLKHAASSSLSAHRFFILVDSFGDLRVVTTSSTSVLNTHESLWYFPPRSSKNCKLCATYNPRQHTVSVYHVKLASRKPAGPGNSMKRKSHILTPMPAKLTEDDIFQDSMQSSFASGLSQSFSAPMDKKRTSTLLSGVSSMGRMASEASLAEPGKILAGSMEMSSFRKEMIWTKIDTLTVRARRPHLTICGLAFENKEAIVVCNTATFETTLCIYSQQSNQHQRHESSFTVRAEHVASLEHPRFPGWLLVLNSSELRLLNPFLDIQTPPIPLNGQLSDLNRIASSFENWVVLYSVPGLQARILSLILEPTTQLCLSCLKSWKYLAGSKIYEQVWVRWRSALMLDPEKNEWDAFVVTVLSMIYPFGRDEPDQLGLQKPIFAFIERAQIIHDNFEVDYSFKDLIPYLAVCLHLLYEELKLDVFAKNDLLKLGSFLTQLTVWMDWLDLWTNFYGVDQAQIDCMVRLLVPSLLYEPPDLFSTLIAMLEAKPLHYRKFSEIFEEGEDADIEMTPRTNMVLHLFSVLSNAHASPPTIVRVMCELKVDSFVIESFPVGIALPLKNCLSICQDSSLSEWTSEALKLVERKDLSRLLNPDEIWPPANGPDSRRMPPSVDDVLDLVTQNSKPEDAKESESERSHVTKLIHDKDRRFNEIQRLLRHNETQSAILVTEEQGEYELTLLKRELASFVATRTLSIPVGSACLKYLGSMPLITETFPIADFDLDALIAPAMTTILFSATSVRPEVLEWGHFHNGAAAGLQISPHAKGITGSWVIFNKSAEMADQHAGFLLGLGLNGHLKSLEEWHIYNYLGPKHPLTSVGLLIGMAASLKGTMDTKLTKVLSVHAVALLPQGANNLYVPVSVQTAGLIGIGLLYLETQHRRMSETLLSQVGGSDLPFDDDDEQEGYRLAAGIALGLVNLGKSHDLRGLNDTRLVDRLLAYATLMRDSQPLVEFDKSGSGATMALMLIYLRSENSLIAMKLRVPSSEQLLDYIRPDLLLLRTMAHNLIMWDNIRPTQAWVESEIPERLERHHSIAAIQALDSDQIPYFAILEGVCLAVAVKYASSHSLEARDTILYYLDHLMKIAELLCNIYDQRIAMQGAIQAQNILALCAALIMAGSGDLEVFRRLRVLHGRVGAKMTYGDHMIVNMGLGMLFLGESHYAFAKTNLAIAALVISIYPVLPSETTHHEAHLQALRHFWALGVTPRCLIVRDVEKSTPCKVPVTIVDRFGGIEKVMTPRLLTNFDDISSIKIRSSEYFDIDINFQVNSGYLEQFKKTLVIYVHKRLNYLTLKSSVSGMLQNQMSFHKRQPITHLMDLPLCEPLSNYEKQVFTNYITEQRDGLGPSELSVPSIINSKLELHRMSVSPKSMLEILNLRLLFAYADHIQGEEAQFLNPAYMEQLKSNLWRIAQATAPKTGTGFE